MRVVAAHREQMLDDEAGDGLDRASLKGLDFSPAGLPGRPIGE